MTEAPIRLALEIEDPRWVVALPDAEALLRRAIEAALASVASGGRPIEVGVRLVDDGAIHALNRDWRGRDAPTNVLSFPLGDPVPVADAEFPWLIGDIVMSLETIERECRRDGKNLPDHVAHLAIHAALHLTGWDHETDGEADRMEAREVELLTQLGVPDPYAGMAEANAAMSGAQ